MKNRIRFITPVLFALIFAACTGAKAPLSDVSQSTITEALVGTWDAVNAGEDEATLIILPFNEHAYYVEFWDDTDKQKERLRVFSTPVDGVLFANVRCLKCDEADEYFFFRYELDEDGILNIQAINNDLYNNELKSITESAEMKRYFVGHVDAPDFFDEQVMKFAKRSERDG